MFPPHDHASHEVCDLSESMRAALEHGNRGVIERLARCIEAGKTDGSMPRTLGAQAVAATLYQTWLGASLLARISRGHVPLNTAMVGTRQRLGLARATSSKPRSGDRFMKSSSER
jgi:TetR/AcrR family transcriptional regulator, transcriptional repressor for nem operon